MATGDAVALLGALSLLIGAWATMRSSVRRADFDRLQTRVVDAEQRLALAEARANTFEQRANQARTDIVELGEQMVKERADNALRLCELTRTYQVKINKLVLIIESLFKRLKDAGLEPADVDLDELRQMIVVEHGEGQDVVANLRAVR